MEKKSSNFSEYSQELLSAAGQIGSILPEMMSTLLKKRISSGSKSAIERQADNALQMVRQVTPTLLGFVDQPRTPAQNFQLFQLIETVMRPFLNDIPEEKSVLDHIIDTLNPNIPVPQDSYLHETNYEQYMNTLKNLALRTSIDVPFKIYEEYLETVFADIEDTLAAGQTLMTEFPKIFRNLSVKRKRYTKKQAERDIEYYDLLAGIFEKRIATVAGLILLSTGKKKTYPAMRKKGLASNLDTVRKSGYSNLADGFDKRIRNAIAHKQVIVHPEKCVVTFYDPRSKITTQETYKTINSKVKELSALVASTNGLPIMVWIQFLINFKNSVASENPLN